MSNRDSPIILHSTPPLDPLPCSDPESLYLAAYLQLACPGRWAIKTGWWGDNGGKLPYITHLNHHIRQNHLTSLPLIEDPDEWLSREDRVDAECWKAYIEQNVIDLVNHTYYSLPPNYPQTIAKTQLQNLHFPENQYIPQRIKSIVRSRLQYVGLWGLGGLNGGDAIDEDRKRSDEAFVVGPAGTLAPRAWSGWTAGRDAEERRKKWGEQELEKKIRSVLDPIVRRLGDELYFFGNRPTTLDLLLFAQLTSILTPVLPNPLFPNLIRSHYPTLVSHHDRILSLLFQNQSWSSIPRLTTPTSTTQKTYLDSFKSLFFDSPVPMQSEDKDDEKKKSEQEKKFQRGRWLWFAGASVAMIGYLLGSGIVSFEFASEPEEVEEEQVVFDDDEDEE